jgi:cyclic pyranopterin monophosphate synthase
MKDVSQKPDSLRVARASAVLHAPAHCIERLRSGDTEKGDALKTARVAGILAAKRTSDLIPLCHPLPIHRADVEFELSGESVCVRAEVQTIGPTGVEMEALTAVSLAALTIYDMLKPYADATELRIEACHLESKRGGKSHYSRRLVTARRAAVLVLSDTVASGAKQDTAGVAVQGVLTEAGFGPVEHSVIPDDAMLLTAAAREHVSAGVDLLVTVGGTGVGSRDITVQTLQPLFDLSIPGVMEAARAFGQQRTPLAMLSRGTAGYIGNTLVVTLPGSRQGALESLTAILPGLVHLLDTGRSDGRHPGGYGEDG